MTFALVFLVFIEMAADSSARDALTAVACVPNGLTGKVNWRERKEKLRNSKSLFEDEVSQNDIRIWRTIVA